MGLKNTEKITGVFLELFKLKEGQGFYKLPPPSWANLQQIKNIYISMP